MRKLLVASFALLAGCSSSSGGADAAGLPAGLEVTLSSDLATLGELRIQADGGGATQFSQTYAVPADAALPATLSFSPSNDLNVPPGSLVPGVVPVVQSGAAMTLTFTATDATTTKTVTRTVETTMPAVVLSLAVKLEAACLDVTCGAGQTCLAGACASDALDDSALSGATY